MNTNIEARHHSALAALAAGRYAEAERTWMDLLYDLPEAHTWLGHMQEAGLGCPRNLAQAWSWYRKGAGRGDPMAAANLGRFCHEGLYVPRDILQAAAWWRQAASKGYPDAQYTLGMAILEDDGTLAANGFDDAIAVGFLKSAAEGGHVGAQYAMGKACAEGKDPSAGDDDLQMWWAQAAENGSAEAAFALAEYYLDFGDLDETALEYAELGAKLGSVDAQFMLGSMYEERRGVFFSVSKMLHWYDLAAAGGHEEAARLAAETREFVESETDLDGIEDVLLEPSAENIQQLLDDDLVVARIARDRDEASLVWDIELVMATRELDAKWLDCTSDENEPSRLIIRYKEKELEVPLTRGPADRHITLCSINEIVAPEFEVRYCADTPKGTPPAFVGLKTRLWSQLESTHGPAAVGRHFLKLTRDRDMYAEQVPSPEAPSRLSRFLGWLSPARPAKSR